MIIENSFKLENLKDLEFYFKLLKEEDFDFRNKNINILILKEKKDLVVKIKAESFLDIKIGFSAVLKSLEIIYKSLNI